MRGSTLTIRRPALSVAGGGSFPVGRILCIGRNYAAHAEEMGDDGRRPPCWFTKSPTALACARPGAPLSVPYPPETSNLQPEVELVVALHRGGRNIHVDQALAHVFGFAVGLDMTRRDRQAEAKEARRPWSQGKDFDHAAPVGTLCPFESLGVAPIGPIQLRVNGALRQTAMLEDMIWSVPELIARLSRSMTLEPGDLLFTGTPSGVGPVVPGDRLHATVAALSESLRVQIT